MSDLQDLIERNQRWAEAIKQEDPQFFEKLAKQQTDTDRKFNRMRPSMARVLGLETRSAKEG